MVPFYYDSTTLIHSSTVIPCLITLISRDFFRQLFHCSSTSVSLYCLTCIILSGLFYNHLVLCANQLSLVPLSYPLIQFGWPITLFLDIITILVKRTVHSKYHLSEENRLFLLRARINDLCRRRVCNYGYKNKEEAVYIVISFCEGSLLHILSSNSA